MDLREYIFRKNLTKTFVANDLMIHRNYLGRIMKGEVKPSKRLAHQIEAYTLGLVPADQIVSVQADMNIS